MKEIKIKEKRLTITRLSPCFSHMERITSVVRLVYLHGLQYSSCLNYIRIYGAITST